MPFGWQELLIILVIVVLLFGGAKLAGVGKATGRAIREFKDEVKGDDPPKAPEPDGPAASITTGQPQGLVYQAPATAEVVQTPPPATDATPVQPETK